MEQWENTYYNTFPDGLWDCVPDGEIYFGSAHDRTQDVLAFIQAQRTAAQVSLLETILREDVPEGSKTIAYWPPTVRERLEARLQALTSNK